MEFSRNDYVHIVALVYNDEEDLSDFLQSAHAKVGTSKAKSSGATHLKLPKLQEHFVFRTMVDAFMEKYAAQNNNIDFALINWELDSIVDFWPEVQEWFREAKSEDAHFVGRERGYLFKETEKVTWNSDSMTIGPKS